MSRYSARSLDVGSSSYNSGSSSSASSSYKSLDSSSSHGSYRSSNLSGYGGSHYGSRTSDGRSAYSSTGGTSGLGSSSGRLLHHGSSYSSRSLSSAMDSVPLPRSSSFGRSEVLPSSTPRDHVVEKGGYSSGLSRSSSIPTHTDGGGSRYSSRSSALGTNHSLDSGSTDAVAERRLRLAERRRLREERGYSETSSDTSKEPSVERASSLRRDSAGSDSTEAIVSAARSRRLAVRLQEASVREEPSSKDSSPDASDAVFRRSHGRLRGSSGSSEDTASSAVDGTVGAETRSSLRQRRGQEVGESSGSGVTSARGVDRTDTETLMQFSAEARKARRQRRLEGLEAASKQPTAQQEEESSKNTSSSTTSTSLRSWRQRLQEQGVSGVSAAESDDGKTRLPKARDEDQPRTTPGNADPASEVTGRGSDKEAEEAGTGRSKQTPEGQSQVADAAATEVESRAERIARYKEERRKQLAHIADITSPSPASPKAQDKEGDAPLSLLTTAKRDKEESPPESTASAPPPADSGGGVSLTTRLWAMHSGSREQDSKGPLKDASDIGTDITQAPAAPRGVKLETPDTQQSGGSDSRTGSSSVRESTDHASSVSKRQTTRSSPPSDSPSQVLSMRKPSSSESPGQHKSTAVSASAAKTTSVSSTVTTASSRKQSTGSRDPIPRKTSSTISDVRSDRKPQDINTAASRKAKSPSPATSRLMAPTRSSAAKVQPNTEPPSPRSSVSPRGSPAPSDKLSIARSASDVSGTKGTKGPPSIKPSLIPELRSKEASASHVSKPAAAKEAEGADVRQRGKVSPQRHAGTETSIPKLSSSSFSTTSSTLSTDRDSGVGSSRLSSSSFSSTRSYDKDTASDKTTAFTKAPRLQRTARVELSSSSSREGSEEKQLTLMEKPAQRISIQSSVKRTASLPSRPVAGDGHQDRSSAGLSSTWQTLRFQARERKTISSSPEKEPSPPADVPVSQKPGRESGKGEAASASLDSGRSRQLATVKEATTPDSSSETASTVSPSAVSPLVSPLAVSPGAGSPSGNVGLDDLLAKNAEFLSDDEETSGSGSRKEQRRLRDGEEPKLRRSLRRKASHKSGSRKSPESDSKGQNKGQMEVEAPPIPTLTLPATTGTSLVAEGAVLRITPSPSQLTAHHHPSPSSSDTAPAAPQNRTSSAKGMTPAPPATSDKGDPAAERDANEKRREVARGSGSESKEATPDSDSVFHTATSSASAPSSVEMPRRRPLLDKSELRKSSLNKASSLPGAASHAGSHDNRGRKGDEEDSKRSSANPSFRPHGVELTVLTNKVSDIRSRFSGGQSGEKSKASEGRSTGVARHPSRGKEFSQLLSKFSSSEASSSERSDSENTQPRRAASFRLPADRDREVSSSSGDDATTRSARNIPERTQSLKVVRPVIRSQGGKEATTTVTAAGEEEGKKVERSASFKSDFMKKRFSPVPPSDAPSEELSQVLNRRHKEVEKQQQGVTDSALITDRRTALAERFKASDIEEVIADSEVASVLKARRQKSETPEDSCSESRRAERTPGVDGKVRKEVKQLVSDVDTSVTTSLTLADRDSSHRGHSHTATKESSPSSSARNDSSMTSSFTLAIGDKASKAADNATTSVKRAETRPRRAQISAEDGSSKSVTESTSLSVSATVTVTTTQDKKEREGSAGKDTYTATLPSSSSSHTVTLPSSSSSSHTVTLPSSSSSHTVTLPSSSSSHVVVPTSTTTTAADSASSSTLRRTESLKQPSTVTRSESFERRRGILKRTPSLPKQPECDPLIDPQLMKIMEQRRLRELEENQKEEEEEEDVSSVAFSRPRALSAAEEIEENIRHMRQTHQAKEGRAVPESEEEAALYKPVSDRIVQMETRLEEVRHTPVTPKSRSGAATPKSARSWSSGSITPRKQVSVDEGVVAEVISEETTTTTTNLATTTSTTTPSQQAMEEEERDTGEQLMERLSTLAASEAKFQERRHKFQKRHREDWRTRTQPITMEEIQEADSLDTVSAFRAQVRRSASKSIFDQLKTQGGQHAHHHRPLPAKSTEFPQHLMPEKRGQRRGRSQRHKTLPVTAEELNAIPEGEAMEPAPLLRDTQVLWKRDSRTDSGILSGSEVESLGSDSLRSLSLEMDSSENDPSRMSVSSKTSLFKSLDERARLEREKEKSASGAKRYIDRKKRERSRTQPVTDDEVQTAAEMSTATAEEKKPQSGPPPGIKLPQPEVVNRPKSPSVDEEAQAEEDDQLTKLSLAEKVKLFSQKKEEQEAAAKVQPRTDSPVPKRRQRKLNSRFNTQPVTPEELEKASKISPLAMSLVKPPDPELLIGLKLKDQQELMMLHAEATLSQCSSPRSGSKPSSQAGSPPRRGSFTAPDTTVGQASTELKKKLEEEKESEKATSSTTTTTAKKSSNHSELSRTDSEPRSILKKAKSIETVHPIDQPSTSTTTASSSVKPAPPNGATTTITMTTTTTTTTTKSSASSSTPKDDSGGEDRDGDRASPVPDLVLPTEPEVANRSAPTAAFFLGDEGLGGESSTDPSAAHLDEEEKEKEEEARTSEDGNKKACATDRKGPAERYLTQPVPQLTPERSPQTKHKYEGRHMTQPITDDEMKEAEFSTTPKSGVSIADRLNQLKTSGEENWKKKVVKDKELNTPVLEVKKREEGVLATRPISITDRLSQLGESTKQWKDKVEESDAVKFTVANKLPKSVVGSESPLVAKIKASSKKDLTRLDDSSNASSPVNSPSTPTKEFLPKVPFPKEIVADPEAAEKKAELKEKQKTERQQVNGGEEEEGKAVRVEVPTLGDEELEQFFSVKEITEISDRVDMDIDDFNNIFIESSEILQSVKKIRPSRKKKATTRNPLKTVSQFLEIQTEYTQVNTGAAEKYHRQIKRDALKQDSGLAVEALAALASVENFGKVELRTATESAVPRADQRNPFSDLMLLHVKGRRNIQTRLVEPSSKSMNAGDCYILVAPDKVINWVGEFCNIIEKAKSADVANYIQQKRDMCYKGSGAVHTVEQAKDHLGAGKQFWGAMHGEKESQACGPEEEDELYESSIIKTNMVYRLEDGALRPYEKYWGTIPKYPMLDSKQLLVFDFGSEFYVWHGRELSGAQRKQGMALAQKLWDKGYDYSQCALNPIAPLRADDDGVPMQSSQRPDWAIFGKVNENMETILFREKFADWPDSSRLIGVKQEKTSEMKSEFADITAYDAKKMIPINNQPVTLRLDGAHVGRGKKWQEDMQGFIKEQDILTLGVKVWHVNDFERYQLPESSYGQFHNGDTYVVRWQYMITNAGLKSLKGQAARQSLTGRERCAYFFWQGQDSTTNEKGVSALMTVELDEERGPQVRVVQGKEPPCFLNLFEGSMVLHIGKREDASTNTAGPWRLYCLRGDQEGEVCLLEISVSITNLRSRSSLVLLNTRTGITYVWHGVKSPQHVRRLVVAAVLSIKEKRPLEMDLHKDAHMVITEMEEGEERAEIWSALDSRDRSLYHSLLTEPARYDYTPRLFHMSSVSMVFEVIEQMNPARLPDVTNPFPFFQSDLYKASQPALFLLDVGPCVYLWQGWWPVGDEDVENVQTGSAAARYNVDRRCAMETTLNYCKERASGRKSPEAFMVCAGVEPLAFQNLFPFWEQDSTVNSMALQEGRAEGYCERVQDMYIKLTQTRYMLDELLERPLPDGVDPLKLESYLADEQFEEVLEMPRTEFYKLPAWKQKDMKKNVGLY